MKCTFDGIWNGGGLWVFMLQTKVRAMRQKSICNSSFPSNQYVVILGQHSMQFYKLVSKWGFPRKKLLGRAPCMATFGMQWSCPILFIFLSHMSKLKFSKIQFSNIFFFIKKTLFFLIFIYYYYYFIYLFIFKFHSQNNFSRF